MDSKPSNQDENEWSTRLEESVVLRFVLAPWGPSPSLYRSHPFRWSPPSFSLSKREPPQHGDGFVELIPFLPNFGEHFVDVHFPRISMFGVGEGSALLRRLFRAAHRVRNPRAHHMCRGITSEATEHPAYTAAPPSNAGSPISRSAHWTESSRRARGRVSHSCRPSSRRS